MCDLELLSHRSGKHRHDVIISSKNDAYQYEHSVSHGTQEDEFVLHSHAMYELEYSLSGDIEYMADGVHYRMEPGSLLLIAPRVPHRLFIRSDTSFERHTFYLEKSQEEGSIGAMAHDAMQNDSRPLSGLYFAPGTVQGVKSLLEDIGSCAGVEKLSSLMPVFVRALLAKIQMHVHLQRPTLLSEFESSMFDDVKEFLSRNLSNDMTLQKIADHFRFSKDYCNRKFSKLTGMSIMQYVKYNRVLHARRLLRAGMAATEVAASVGFKDYSCFYRNYRAVTGRSPSDEKIKNDKAAAQQEEIFR